MSELSHRKQIRLVQKTSIFVAGHGAAHALTMFLPPQAVVVEIMPFKFSPGNPFHHGYQNFARICKRSHVLWQNTQAAWSQGEGKQSDTLLPVFAILETADLSILQLKRKCEGLEALRFSALRHPAVWINDTFSAAMLEVSPNSLDSRHINKEKLVELIWWGASCCLSKSDIVMVKHLGIVYVVRTM